MKKLVLILLAIAMLSVSVAYAAGSPTGGDAEGYDSRPPFYNRNPVDNGPTYSAIRLTGAEETAAIEAFKAAGYTAEVADVYRVTLTSGKAAAGRAINLTSGSAYDANKKYGAYANIAGAYSAVAAQAANSTVSVQVTADVAAAFNNGSSVDFVITEAE